MSFEKKEQNEVKIFGCVFSLVIIQGKLIRRVMTPISKTYIFDKSTDDFFMKFYRAREQMVLRARRLIRVLRVRLLRSMC